MGVDLLQDGLLRFHATSQPDPTSELETYRALADATKQPEPATAPQCTCALCKTRPATQRCLHCDKSVCRDDWWTMIGLCNECATEDEVAAAREGRDRKRPDLGIKWVEE
jgi:hypothetical protein